MIRTVEFPDSKSVKKADYDSEKEELILEFAQGSRYLYTDVPVSVFEGLKESSSPGSYVSKEIKGKFAFEKL